MNIFCPHCGQGYDVSEKHLNQKFICQTCNKEFEIKFDPTKKRCPACGEEILAVAKKCRFCGENLEPREEEPDHWPVWKIYIAMIAIVILCGFLIYAFGEAGLYIIGSLIGFSFTVFIISKICEIARNTKK